MALVSNFSTSTCECTGLDATRIEAVTSKLVLVVQELIFNVEIRVEAGEHVQTWPYQATAEVLDVLLARTDLTVTLDRAVLLP